MSVVYRGHDPVLDRAVAIKVLHPHLAGRADSRTRFTREARAAARLQHPNIVEVYDYAPPDSERAYIVTEYIEGPTLRAFVESHPMRHAEAAALLMIPVFEALQDAHTQGIVHRDVKPENIMLRRDGTPVLMDFGIAQMVDTESLTATGTMLGSPAHMAPEVVEGEPITTAADLFSAGTVLYWMVCGALPFSGPTPAALFRRILESRFDPVLQRKPQAGRAVARLIEQCMQRDPTARPASAMAVAQSLRDMVANGGLTDLPRERAALMADPEVYQEALGRRLVAPYLAAARVAYNAQATARALDLLDRVLSLDEENPEAKSLLGRIERGRRASRAARLGVGAALLGVTTFAALRFWPDPVTPPTTDAGVLSMGPGSTLGQPVVADAFAAVRPADARAADARVVDARPPDAGPVDAARVPDRAVASRAPASRAPRPIVVRTPTSVANSAPASLVVPEVPKIEVTFKGGLVKNFNLEINGQARGPAGLREKAGQGIMLPPGRHRIRMTNAWCEDHEVLLTLAKDSPLQVVTYECQLRPSVVKVRAATSLPVYDSTGAQLGLTNQDLSIAMKRLEEQRRLTVVDPGGTLRPVLVSLVAGKRQEITIGR